MKPSLDLEKIFTYQVIFSVNWHKVLYPLLIVSISNMDSHRKSKETETAIIKSILEFFSVFSLDFSMQLPIFSTFCGNQAGDVFEGFLKSALNFASQELLHFDWHKVLYSPSH